MVVIESTGTYPRSGRVGGRVMVAGVAVGAAAVGYLIDSSGAQAGFVAVAIAGLLLTLSALFVRGPHPSVIGPDSTGTPAAESSRPPVGTHS